MNDITPKEAIANLNHLYGFVSPDIQRSLDAAFKCMEERPQGDSGDLISREALKDAIHNSNLSGNREWLIMELDKIIDNAPTVEPERLQGEWIKEPNGKTTDIYRCSLCKRSIMLCKGADLSKYPFCHCGADMQKGGAE